jgi:hypothetical protein
MLKNYFRIAWRNLIKNKTSSLINIGGLAVGMAVALQPLHQLAHLGGQDDHPRAGFAPNSL